MRGLDSARAVADAVLFEGYLLYPYRASAPKNQVRWQWGVLMARDVTEIDPSERSGARTDVIVDGRPESLTLHLRFLQVQGRTVERAQGDGFVAVDALEVEGTRYTPWDEAVEHELDIPVDLEPDQRSLVIEVAGGTSTEEVHAADGTLAGRFVRVRQPLSIGVTVTTTRPSMPFPVAVVSVRVENETPAPATSEPGGRPAWLRRAIVACHLLMHLEGASFVSLLDPPEWAKPLVDGCVNEGLFPVLGAPGEDRSVVLSSPIILYDHPEIAAESESSFFDSLEIDELLSLRTMTLTDEEKREMRGTDPRAAGLLDEVESMPPELFDRLHGTVRYLDAMTTRPSSADESPEQLPWWDPGVDGSVDPDQDVVRVGEVDVRRGSRVVLRPGARRADAYDLFLAGRTATVAGVFTDVDDAVHLAVTLDDDPGADLKLAHGRYLYFAPDEVEALASPVGGESP